MDASMIYPNNAFLVIFWSLFLLKLYNYTIITQLLPKPANAPEIIPIVKIFLS